MACTEMLMTKGRSRVSRRRLRGIEEPLEIWTVEFRDGPLVLLHPPGPEVEVDVAGGVLDGRPQGPPVLGHEPEEPSSRHLDAGMTPEVRRDQLFQPVWRQGRFAPEVAEFEAGVIVARVLEIDEPQPLTVVQDVGGEQIVVARHRYVREG